MENYAIKGVSINLDADDLKKLKSRKALSKLNIFEHLSDEDKVAAENELAIKIGLVAADEAPAEQ